MKVEDFLTKDEFAEFYDSVQAAVLNVYPQAVPKVSHNMMAWQTDKGHHSYRIILYAAAREQWFGLYLKAAVRIRLVSDINAKGYETSGGAVHVPYDINLTDLSELTNWIVRETLDYFEEEYQGK